ncbi:secondary thiamine-phosphate synthase enzyme YjbQ [Mariprofundus sp. KV]|uniref:secondary thiamine-phosphate synthase enzyme YjbQ n=1 Tax=Mariprofundus sp. KV TaxID=2608715 RepID=UPI0015A3F648|nr:secondary thiamine-phosphate synthase enzyme YjbQ [Mariprofundus sp. KV]NWF35436.1 hypothetical protein [Mariprofundus sp. KV]
MKQFQQTLTIQCHEQGFNDFTRALKMVVHQANFDGGLLALFTPDVGCSLSVQEKNAPGNRDRMEIMTGHHDNEAHARADLHEVDLHDHTRMAMTSPSLSIPIQNGRPVLGTWQAVCLYEHHSHANTRNIFLHIVGN